MPGDHLDDPTILDKAPDRGGRGGERLEVEPGETGDPGVQGEEEVSDEKEVPNPDHDRVGGVARCWIDLRDGSPSDGQPLSLEPRRATGLAPELPRAVRGRTREEADRDRAPRQGLAEEVGRGEDRVAFCEHGGAPLVRCEHRPKPTEPAGRRDRLEDVVDVAVRQDDHERARRRGQCLAGKPGEEGRLGRIRPRIDGEHRPGAGGNEGVRAADVRPPEKGAVPGRRKAGHRAPRCRGHPFAVERLRG
ncbi:hypothetical protein DSECCO2_519090 [anaerobic digester metagenome]